MPLSQPVECRWPGRPRPGRTAPGRWSRRRCWGSVPGCSARASPGRTADDTAVGDEGETRRPRRRSVRATPAHFENTCTRSVRLAGRGRSASTTVRPTRRLRFPTLRRIPEATVARLPLYYRALLETAEHEVGTISSERLAELAGVNAAKVRKDLSYLGPTAPGASATTSSTCSTRSPASSASPTTGRSRSSASATSARRSRTTGASAPAASASWRSSTPTRRRSGERGRRPRRSSRSTTSTDIVARARDRDRHHRHARRRRRRRSPTASSPPGVTLDPQLRAGGRDRARAACRCARSTSRSSCRSCPSTNCARGAEPRPERRDGRRPRGDERTPRRPGSPGYPVNLLVARPPRASWSAPGASRPARSSRCSTPGADVHVVAPDVGDEVRGLGRRRPARAAPSGAFEPADLDGAWLAITATDDPAVERARCSRPARPRRVWVNSADDPRTARSRSCRWSAGATSWSRRHRRAQPGARRVPAAALDRGARARVRDAARPALARPGKSCGPPGVPAKTPIGRRALRFRHRST